MQFYRSCQSRVEHSLLPCLIVFFATMPRVVQTEVEIAAPAERVWSVFMDWGAFPAWNPFIKGLQGEPAVGARLQLEVQPPGRGLSTFRPVVLSGKLVSSSGGRLNCRAFLGCTNSASIPASRPASCPASCTRPASLCAAQPTPPRRPSLCAAPAACSRPQQGVSLAGQALGAARPLHRGALLSAGGGGPRPNQVCAGRELHRAAAPPGGRRRLGGDRGGILPDECCAQGAGGGRQLLRVPGGSAGLAEHPPSVR